VTCVAVTRGGMGEPWLFESRAEADLHPLVQYGDALLSGPEDVLTQYGLHQLPLLLRVIGDEHLTRRVLSAVPDPGVAREVKRREAAEQHTAAVFAALEARAKAPPASPARVCELIRRDRELYSEERRKMPEVTNTAAGGKSKAAAAAKPAKDVKPPRYPSDSVITLLADKDGKAYGKNNNPKRAGSKAAEHFALYTSGMKVGKFIEAGGTLADLAFDEGKKFIKVAPKA